MENYPQRSVISIFIGPALYLYYHSSYQMYTCYYMEIYMCINHVIFLHCIIVTRGLLYCSDHRSFATSQLCSSDQIFRVPPHFYIFVIPLTAVLSSYLSLFKNRILSSNPTIFFPSISFLFHCTIPDLSSATVVIQLLYFFSILSNSL